MERVLSMKVCYRKNTDLYVIRVVEITNDCYDVLKILMGVRTGNGRRLLTTSDKNMAISYAKKYSDISPNEL
jgi:hypothetical protein